MEVIATLDVTKLPPDKVPARLKAALKNPDSTMDRVRVNYSIDSRILRTLEKAGIPIAAGTDAANIGTIHGPVLFESFSS